MIALRELELGRPDTETATRPVKPLFQVIVSPNNFRRIIDLGRCGIPYSVTVLDEKIMYLSPDGNTVRIRQYFLGDPNDPFLSYGVENLHGRHPNERVREFYRVKMRFGDGTEEIAIKEIDLRNSFG